MNRLAAIIALLAHTAAAAEKFVFEKAEMGIPFRVSLYAENESAAREAADAAFAKVATLNAVFSHYEFDSELSQLSRSAGTGKPVPLSDPLWTVLSAAHKLAAQTDGAFDPTCGPLTAMWRHARRKNELPSPALTAEMLARCGWKKLRLDAKTAELLAPDMQLDLGAIAKGFACDAALAVLRERGFPSALVTGSGDMAAGDPPPGRKGWRVELMPLDATGGEKATTAFVEIAHCGFATSGDRFQRLDAAGKRYSHILDVRTGQPLTDHSMVFIIAPDCMTADSLSTTISVIGPEEGIKLAAKYRAEVRIQRQPGEKVEITESPGWPK